MEVEGVLLWGGMRKAQVAEQASLLLDLIDDMVCGMRTRC